MPAKGAVWVLPLTPLELSVTVSVAVFLVNLVDNGGWNLTVIAQLAPAAKLVPQSFAAGTVGIREN